MLVGILTNRIIALLIEYFVRQITKLFHKIVTIILNMRQGETLGEELN